MIRVTVANNWKTEFDYDGSLRRRIKREYSWDGAAFVKTNEVRYVYDGNSAIQYRDSNNVPILTLSRLGEQLLARTDLTTNTPVHAYFHADGNGNITALVSTQSVVDHG